jgi:dolichol-phosphate mannosyltransferase
MESVAAQESSSNSVPTASVIIPTFNEAGNIELLLDRIDQAMGAASPPLSYQAIVVDDDSPDGTWQLAEKRAEGDARVVAIRRTEERGLSSAVLAGMAAAEGRVLVVIDGDLQHDEQKIPALVDKVLAGADICLGSRQAEGGGYGSFTRRRRLISHVGALIATLALGLKVTDPMSGFFAVSRERYDAVKHEANPRGFKILLEFLSRPPRPSVAEVGYVFGDRHSGSTKLTGSVIGSYLLNVADLAMLRVRR